MERSIIQDFGFNIEPFEPLSTVSSNSNYTKLSLSPSDKAQISVLAQQFPEMGITAASNQLYLMTNPKGLKGVQMSLKQGGVSTVVKGSDGKIVGTTSLYSAAPAAAFLGAFTVMAVATGQYFMSMINSELSMLNSKIDDILNFLYGDKQSELLSEISFVQHAQQNYDTIMQNEAQRIATITSLQNSRKVAMKDIEFYITDLHNLTYRNVDRQLTLEKIVSRAFEIKSTLDMALQLYIASNAMEIYYSQNMEDTYIDSVKSQTSIYTKKCNLRMLECYSALKTKVLDSKDKKFDKETAEKHLSDNINFLNSDKANENEKNIHSMLDTINKPIKFVVDGKTGDVMYIAPETA